jgi:hypothetical protein
MTTLGTCPVCRRLYTLTENGTMPSHLEKHVSGRETSPPCQGVGEPPADRATEK